MSNEGLADVISISEVLDFMEWLNEQYWTKATYGEKEGLWISIHNEQGITTEEVLEHWINDYC